MEGFLGENIYVRGIEISIPELHLKINFKRMKICNGFDADKMLSFMIFLVEITDCFGKF